MSDRAAAGGDGVKSLDLSGAWKLRWFDGNRNGRPEFAEHATTDESRYLDAAVPGEVHLDLARAGVIADPLDGVNILAARWVEECMWAYRRRFECPAEAAEARVWLVFECLDHTARIVLNGVEVGRHHNSFLPCRIDVTGKLKAGGNILTVHLESGLFEVSEKPIAAYAFGKDELLTKRQWLRKLMHESGSIDWSNRLMNVGIQGPVALEWTAAPARMDQLVPLVEVSPDLSTGTVVVRQFVEGLAETGASAIPARLTAELVEADVSASEDIELMHGSHPYEVTLRLDHPDLWWPRGQGAQRRYSLKVRVEAAGSVIGEKTATIGFRRVRFRQEPHADGGRYFYLEVNNRPVFVKGSNLIPSDLIVSSVGPERNETLVDLAVEANFNYLRVWGGGYYEPEAFYDRCDRQGVMVWQEFSHAVLVLPAHDPHGTTTPWPSRSIRSAGSRAILRSWLGAATTRWTATPTADTTAARTGPGIPITDSSTSRCRPARSKPGTSIRGSWACATTTSASIGISNAGSRSRVESSDPGACPRC